MIAASMTADGNTSGHPSLCGPRPAPAPSRPSGCRQPRWRHLLAGLSQCHRGVRRHPAFGLVPEIFQSACLRAGPRIRDPLLPITRKLTAWQAHDGPTAEDMPGAIELGRIPRADTAYDSNRLRDHLAGVGAKAVIKPIPRRSAPPPLDRGGPPASTADRAHLLKAQILQSYSNHIQETRRQLPRPRQKWQPHASGCALMSRCPRAKGVCRGWQGIRRVRGSGWRCHTGQTSVSRHACGTARTKSPTRDQPLCLWLGSG